jgi:hypothetical protein
MKGHRHLKLVVSNDAPTTIDGLVARYSAANEHWGRTKTEAAREAARLAYNAWVSAAYPPSEAAPLIIGKAQHWGFR